MGSRGPVLVAWIRYYSRADLDLMLEAVAKGYEAAETTQSVIEIAFPVVIVLLLVALGWFVVRRGLERAASHRAGQGALRPPQSPGVF